MEITNPPALFKPCLCEHRAHETADSPHLEGQGRELSAVRARSPTAGPEGTSEPLVRLTVLLSASAAALGTEGNSLIREREIPGVPSCPEFPRPDPHVSPFIIYEGSFTGRLPEP